MNYIYKLNNYKKNLRKDNIISIILSKIIEVNL